MTEYQQIARKLTQRPRKGATEMMSFMKRFVYVEKEKTFDSVTYEEIMI